MPLVIEKTDAEGFELHEPDEWFDGVVTDIQDLPDGQWGPGLKWFIELDDDDPFDDGSKPEIWAFCSQKLSPRSKLYGWAKALGWDPDSETIDLGEFIGSRVQIMFEQYEGSDPDGNAVTKEKVVKIRKGKGKGKKKTPLKAVEDEADDAPF